MAKSSVRKSTLGKTPSAKVVSGRITKSSNASTSRPIISSTNVAAVKQVVNQKKTHKKTSKPTSETESSSEDEENSVSTDQDSDSSEESDNSSTEEDDSESESEKALTSSAKKLPNGNTKAATPESSDDDSATEDSEPDSKGSSKDSSDDDSTFEESSSAEKLESAKASLNGTQKKAGSKIANGMIKSVKAKTKDETSDSEEDTNTDSSESEESGNGTDSADNSSEASSESDETQEEEKPVLPNKKRKAETEVQLTENDANAKKAKTSAILFAGNLSWNVDDDWLAKEFRSCEGFIGARVVSSQGRSKGFGYIDFSSPEAAQAALESMTDAEIDSRKINLDFSAPRSDDQRPPTVRAFDRAKERGDSLSPESDTLFVGNLPFNVNEDDVSAHFNGVAAVISLRLPTDRETGNRKGFGYVSFASIEDAKSALNQLNGSYIGGRSIRLDFSGPRASQEVGNRGGRGGARGGGRGGARGGGRGNARGGRDNRGRGFQSGRNQGIQAGQGKKTTFD